MNNFDGYKKLLSEFVSFKSVSTDIKFTQEIEDTVAWLKNLFIQNKFKVEVWKSKEANPVLFADYKAGSGLKTVLIYGHYDVQPAELSDGWRTEPFSLNTDNKKLYARGVVDNKGQILIHIFTILNLIKKGGLKYNVKFLIEGNEETGNLSLPSLMAKNKKKVDCDVLLISDGELTNDQPTIEVSLRGGFNCKLTYMTGKNSLHSGIFGGAVPNAPKELTAFLAKLIKPDNTISYKGFYKGMDKISQSELVNNKRLTEEAKDLAKLAGVEKLLGKKNVDFYTLTGLMPTIQISGFKSGYIDEGYSNIVPSQAEVRLNFRIVCSQKSEEVFKSFSGFVKQNTPPYVKYKLETYGLHEPIKISLNNPYVAKTVSLLEEVYMSKVNRKNVGGAIPFVADVKSILGVDTLLIPLVNEDCNMHGTDENFDIKLAKKALKFSQAFFSK